MFFEGDAAASAPSAGRPRPASAGRPAQPAPAAGAAGARQDARSASTPARPPRPRPPRRPREGSRRDQEPEDPDHGGRPRGRDGRLLDAGALAQARGARPSSTPDVATAKTEALPPGPGHARHLREGARRLQDATTPPWSASARPFPATTTSARWWCSSTPRPSAATWTSARSRSASGASQRRGPGHRRGPTPPPGAVSVGDGRLHGDAVQLRLRRELRQPVDVLLPARALRDGRQRPTRRDRPAPAGGEPDAQARPSAATRSSRPRSARARTCCRPPQGVTAGGTPGRARHHAGRRRAARRRQHAGTTPPTTTATTTGAIR